MKNKITKKRKHYIPRSNFLCIMIKKGTQCYFTRGNRALLRDNDASLLNHSVINESQMISEEKKGST